MHKAQTREVGVLLFNQFSTHCLANAVEPLRAANDLARARLYSWTYLSLDGAPVRSSSGLPVTPAARLSRHAGGDLLLVIPSYGVSDHDTPATARALRAASARFRALAGLDMGAWLLASAGLLDRRRATVHWDELDRFAETFPDVLTSPERFVADHPVHSCGGGVTALDLMLHLITRDQGAMLSLEVAALFMYGERPPQSQAPPGSEVEAAVALMRRNLEAPLPIGAIARRLGLSQRGLEAAFQRRIGQSPRAVYLSLRLSAARRMVESTRLSVAEIALRCGYEDPSAMTRAFRGAFGTTPRALRRTTGPQDITAQPQT